MGRDPTEQAAPDLFSTDLVRDASAVSTKPPATETPVNAPSQKHVLPKKLRHAIAQLNDAEWDELFKIAFDEAKRRGRLPRNFETDLATLWSRRRSDLASKPTPPTDKPRQVNISEVSLTRGQVNAVRAAFKAGITPYELRDSSGFL